MLANTTGLLAAVVAAIYIPIIAYYNNWPHVVIGSAQIPLWLLVLPLNARGRTWGAATSLVFTSLLMFFGQAAMYGLDYGHHLFAFVIASAAFLLYPPRFAKTMWMAVVVTGAVLVVFVAWGDVIAYEVLGDGTQPLFPLAEEAKVVIAPTYLGVYFVIALLASRSRSRTLEAEQSLAREFEKSEALLRNILPEAIAAQLKDGSGTIAEDFDEVTVIFADIVDFTPMSARMSAHEVVSVLNDVFTEFDKIAEHRGLEKIKTIGDAYMVAGGLPERRDDHADAAAGMALDMVKVCRERNPPIELRIGIHTGQVTAGVIGLRKFAYDLWGDTVNTASRMESHSEPGEIQVTDATHNKLKGKYEFVARGTIEIKGIGQMRTWYLRGSK